MSLSEGDAFRVIATHGAPAAFVEQRRRDPLVRATPGHNLERMVRTKDVVTFQTYRPTQYRRPSLPSLAVRKRS